MIDKYGEKYVATVHSGKPLLLTCLHLAAMGGNIGLINLLFNASADLERITTRHRTPLHFAVLNNHSQAISLLLDLGANIEARNKHKQTGGFIIRGSVFQSILCTMSSLELFSGTAWNLELL